MNDWESFSWTKKIFLAVLVTFLAISSPELMLFIDVGGVEMALSFLLLYYKPLIVWIQKRIDSIEEHLNTLKYIVLNSSLMNPKVFICHSIYSLFAMWITGAIIFSLGLMLPTLFVSQMTV